MLGRISASIQAFGDSVTMQIESKSRFNAKLTARFIASASAWRGRVVFTLFEQANTNSPLQSLATAAIDELSKLQDATTLILIEFLSGLVEPLVLTQRW